MSARCHSHLSRGGRQPVPKCNHKRTSHIQYSYGWRGIGSHMHTYLIFQLMDVRLESFHSWRPGITDDIKRITSCTDTRSESLCIFGRHVLEMQQASAGIYRRIKYRRKWPRTIFAIATHVPRSCVVCALLNNKYICLVRTEHRTERVRHVSKQQISFYLKAWELGNFQCALHPKAYHR